MTSITSWDPGKITGVAFGHFDDETPYTLEVALALDFFQISEMFWNSPNNTSTVVVIERFVPRGGQPFAPDLEGVQVEGMLRHFYQPDQIVWQTRTDKAHVPDRILKGNGLWQTGSDVSWEDGRDANDAIIHALAYLKKNSHLPTLRKYWGIEKGAEAPNS